MSERYRIGEIAKIKRIDAQTLRYYDRMGILSPAIIDEENGYRYYTQDQFVEVDRIKFYKTLGLSLEEIKEFKKIDNIEEALKTLEIQKKNCEEKISKMEALKNKISHIIGDIDHALLEIKENGRALRVEDCGSLYGVGSKGHQIRGWFQLENILNEVMGRYPQYDDRCHHRLIMIFEEGYLEEDNLNRLQRILLPIEKEKAGEPHVERYYLGRCLVGYHQGNHDKKHETYKELRNYMKEHQLTPRGDVIIVPIINSFILSNPEENIMKIMIPFKNKSY